MRNISVNNEEYVDLGLSVKWCSHNVGCVKPSDYGIYLAWGGIAEKCSYAASYYDYNKPFEDVGEKHGLGGKGAYTGRVPGIGGQMPIVLG